MEIKKTFLGVFLVLIMAAACGSGSTAKSDDKKTTNQPNNIFNPNAVTKEQYVSTRADVRLFISNLNSIISKKDFNSWKEALSPEYIAAISSPENLDRISETTAMKAQKIVLKTLEDYFKHLVVPSRENVDVDKIDIEFLSEYRVQAFTMTTTRTGEERRVRLYDLEKSGNVWKIIN